MKTKLTLYLLAALLGALCLLWSTAQAQPATVGNALSLNGVSQYVSITNGINPNDAQRFVSIRVP